MAGKSATPFQNLWIRPCIWYCVFSFCCLWLLFWYISLFFLYQLSFNAVSYNGFAFSHSSSMQDTSFIYHVSVMSYDSWWVVVFCVDIKRLFDRFPDWEKVFSCRIKSFTSKKSLLQSLISMVIASPSFLKKAMMFYLNLCNSISYLFYPSTTINSSKFPISV